MQFLMSEASEESFTETRVADKVADNVLKARRAVIDECKESDGVVKMINGDDANIL